MSDDKLTIGIIGTGAGNARALAGDGVAPIKDPITAAPVISGPHGRAWLCDLANGLKQKGFKPEDDACIAHWIIEAPWAHSAWHSYSIVLVHLRPMPDGRRTLIYLDEATHELWVHAMAPDHDRNKVLATGIPTGAWLSPKNFASQFIEISDELARDRVKAAIQQICDGKLSPDTDYQHQWVRLFGDSMMKDRPNHRPPKIRE
jgi:hypothetical protein